MLVFTVSYVTAAVCLFAVVPHHSSETAGISLLSLVCPLNSAVKRKKRESSCGSLALCSISDPLTPTQMAKHNGQRLCIDLKYSHTTQKLCFMFGFNTTHWLSEKKIMTLLDKRNSSDVNTTSEVMCFVLFRCYKARVLWDFGCEKQKVCKMLCGVCCPVGQMIVGCVCLHTVKASMTIYLLCLAERTPNRRFQSLAISFFSGTGATIVKILGLGFF